jgi:hypothetical protein
MGPIPFNKIEIKISSVKEGIDLLRFPNFYKTNQEENRETNYYFKKYFSNHARLVFRSKVLNKTQEMFGLDVIIKKFFNILKRYIKDMFLLNCAKFTSALFCNGASEKTFICTHVKLDY